MSTKNDYYDILGVNKTANAQEIKTAYRKKALEWHPDRHQGGDKEEAEKKFKEINEAYQVLGDEKKRATYDRFGSAAFDQGGAGPGPGGFGGGFGGFGGFDFGNVDADGFGDFGDVLGQMFGFGGGGGGFGGGGASSGW